MASAPARTAGDGDTTHVDEVRAVPAVTAGAHGPGHAGEHTALRRAAQSAARAAEMRAATAAAEAKAAIAAAARAAATADAAAQEAEQADAAVRAAAQAETRAAADAARRMARWAPAPRAATDDLTSLDLLRDRPAHAAPSADAGGVEDTARHRPTRAGGRGADEIDVTALVPSPTGRAARRRAATAETTMFSPVTDDPANAPVDDDPAEDGGPPTAVAPAAVAAPPPRATAAPATPTRSRRSRRRTGLLRRPTQPVLVAAAAGGVLALAGVLFAGDAVRSQPQPAALVESAAPSSQPTVPILPSAAEVPADPAGDDEGSVADTGATEGRSAEFLQELRAAGVPTSRGGIAETEAAELVCNELADGVDEARIAGALPASLPTVSRAQAADLVDIARDGYCG